MDKLGYMQLDRIEQKLDAVCGHLGLIKEETQEPPKDEAPKEKKILGIFKKKGKEVMPCGNNECKYNLKGECNHKPLIKDCGEWKE